MKVKKVLKDMILKWHEDGISLDETARLIPQVPRDDIEAIIKNHHE